MIKTNGVSHFPHKIANIHFACCVCCVFPNGEYLTAEGRCDGTISYGGMGYGGFGYDPIFVYPPMYKTFAQMTEDEKNEVSHRGKALREFSRKLKEYLAARKDR